jgi:hypothetical protein
MSLLLYNICHLWQEINPKHVLFSRRKPQIRNSTRSEACAKQIQNPNDQMSKTAKAVSGGMRSVGIVHMVSWFWISVIRYCLRLTP